MLEKGDRVVVGYSGGKDSSALLFLLNKIKRIYKLEITAITIIEGISGYRDHLNERLIALPKKLKISQKIEYFSEWFGMTIDEVAKHRQPCSVCGVWRRKILDEIAKELDATKVAIGHNLDDVAETVIMNLLRNEPLRLKRYFFPSGKEFIPRIRPLMFIPEKEVNVFATLHNLPRDERSCPYRSSSLRFAVKKLIDDLETKFPGAKFRIANSGIEISKLLTEENSQLKRCKICGRPTTGEICMACKMERELK